MSDENKKPSLDDERRLTRIVVRGVAAVMLLMMFGGFAGGVIGASLAARSLDYRSDCSEWDRRDPIMDAVCESRSFNHAAIGAAIGTAGVLLLTWILSYGVTSRHAPRPE